MKNQICIFFAAMLLLFSVACNDQQRPKVKEREELVILENSGIKILYDTDNGFYDVFDKKENKTILSGVSYEFNGLSSKSPELIHSWTSEEVSDTLGAGTKLIISSAGEQMDELHYEITLYDNEGFFTLNWAYKNNSNENIQLKKAKVLQADAYTGYQFDNYKVLDGESNDFQTRVWDDDTVSCKNNLLVTFGPKGGDKNSIVIGGLTYHEFEKFAEVVNQDDHLKLTLWAEDPVGKRIDAGSKYQPDEKFFVNFSIDNRFEILEDYGRKLAAANNVDISGMDFPIINFWYGYHPRFGGDEFMNNSTGVVEVLKQAYGTGFGKYSKIGVRLEPDDYSEPNNQQGWWDDEHWQMYENGQLIEPLETMEKWAAAVKETGGEPLIYMQTNRRSEDYALAHPDHMLFNETHKERSAGMGGWWQDGNKYWGYDFTDPGFVQHMKDVYSYLRESGIKGIKYDYPLTGWCYEGGFEDPYATTGAAYRKIYELAYYGMGPGTDIHERMGPSDITLGVITTQRTEGDNDIVIPPMTAKTGLRWYKNRVVYHADQDARNPYRAIPRDKRYAWQAMYTMTYVTSGRMEIGKYFHKMSDEMLYDLSRVVPLHQNPQSSRPIDAFFGKDYPEIYDFAVNDDWHLLTFYNTAWTGEDWPRHWSDRIKEMPGEMVSSTIEVSLADATDEGGLGLSANDEYYVWDFWNEKLVGIFPGTEKLSQDMRAGEAKMMAVHKVKGHPQFISTNRHIMQGYVDMPVKPEWNSDANLLKGTSTVPQEEDYKIAMAANGSAPQAVSVSSGYTEWNWIDEEKGIFEVVIRTTKTGNVDWEVNF